MKHTKKEYSNRQYNKDCRALHTLLIDALEEHYDNIKHEHEDEVSCFVYPSVFVEILASHYAYFLSPDEEKVDRFLSEIKRLILEKIDEDELKYGYEIQGEA